MRRRRRRLGTCGAYALPASRRPMRIAGAHGPRRGDSRPQAVFSELALLCPTAGDVHDMAKIESGHFDLREEETVVADMLASCLPRSRVPATCRFQRGSPKIAPLKFASPIPASA